MTERQLTLNDKVLLASLKLSKGDIHNKFTAEELLVEAWKNDKTSFGLRGYENEYPDSNNLYTKLMGKSSLVHLGYLKKVSEKTYTLTEAGLSIASSLEPTQSETKIKAARYLNEAILKIINHKVFIEWLKDKDKPKNFRDAMWFWGIAPGTPPKTVEERLAVIERNLQEAKRIAIEEGGKIVLDSRGLNKDSKENLLKSGSTSIDENKGRLFLDITDIERCIEFNETLKNRFKKELDIMVKKN
jgi:hypothetical protein